MTNTIILVKNVKYGNSSKVVAYFKYENSEDLDLFNESVSQDWNSHWDWTTFDMSDEFDHYLLLTKKQGTLTEILDAISYWEDESYYDYSAKLLAIERANKNPERWAEMLEKINEAAWISEYKPEVNEF